MADVFQPGLQLGPYRLIRLLNAGGMGQVWKAYRLRGGGQRPQTVAIKLARLSAVLDSRVIAGLRLEADVLACLKHPLIPELIDAAEIDGLFILVMEYIPGVPLSELIWRLAKEAQMVGEPLALHILHELCVVLHYVHNADIDQKPQGIVHRDIATKNMLVRGKGLVHLVDFGVAKVNRLETSHHTIKGTLRYMAPEAVGGLTIPAGDIFGAGTVLYECLVGYPFRRPWVDKDLSRVAMTGEYEPLPSHVSAFPRMLCEKMVHRDPDMRPTAAEILAMLEEEGIPNRCMALGELVTFEFGHAADRSGLTNDMPAITDELRNTVAAAKLRISNPLEVFVRAGGHASDLEAAVGSTIRRSPVELLGQRQHAPPPGEGPTAGSRSADPGFAFDPTSPGQASTDGRAPTVTMPRPPQPSPPFGPPPDPSATEGLAPTAPVPPPLEPTAPILPLPEPTVPFARPTASAPSIDSAAFQAWSHMGSGLESFVGGATLATDPDVVSRLNHEPPRAEREATSNDLRDPPLDPPISGTGVAWAGGWPTGTSAARMQQPVWPPPPHSTPADAEAAEPPRARAEVPRGTIAMRIGGVIGTIAIATVIGVGISVDLTLGDRGREIDALTGELVDTRTEVVTEPEPLAEPSVALVVSLPATSVLHADIPRAPDESIGPPPSARAKSDVLSPTAVVAQSSRVEEAPSPSPAVTKPAASKSRGSSPQPAPTPKVKVTVHRLFVDFAELQIGGRTFEIKRKSEVLLVRPGSNKAKAHTLRSRTVPNGSWVDATDFDGLVPGFDYNIYIVEGGLRHGRTKASEGAAKP